MVLFNRLHIWIRSKEAHNDRMDMWPKGFWKGKDAVGFAVGRFNIMLFFGINKY